MEKESELQKKKVMYFCTKHILIITDIIYKENFVEFVFLIVQIDTAVKFLQNPRVRQTPMKQRRAFLEKKGLTKEEIDQAIALSGTESDEHTAPSSVTMATQQALASPSLPPPPPPPPIVPWRGYIGAAVIGGGLGYLLVNLIKTYIMPLIFNMKQKDEKLDKLEAAIAETNSTVTSAVGSLQTSLESVQEILVHQEKLIKGLSCDFAQTQDKISGLPVDAYTTADLKSEIASLKGLLLSRKQFPQAVGGSPQLAGIPAWQRATPTASKSLSFAEGTKGGDGASNNEHTHMNGHTIDSSSNKNPEASPTSTASSSNTSSPVTVKSNPSFEEKSMNDAILADDGDISGDTTLSSLSDLSASASFNEASIAFSSTCIKIPSDIISGEAQPEVD